MKHNFDNYIYFTISELLYEKYKKDKNSTSFVSFCQLLWNIVRINDPKSNYFNIILFLNKNLKLIYNLSDEEIVNYLFRYLEKEIYTKHYNIVIKIMDAFPDAYN